MTSDDTRKTKEENERFWPSSWSHRLPEHLIVDHHFNVIITASNEAKSRVRCQLNVRYGDSERQTYDIFDLQSTPSDAAIVVFVHGGCWQAGNKEANCFMAEVIANAGGILITLGYDLCPQVTMTEMANQVQKAVDSIHRLAMERRSKRVVLIGHSAGAHLITMSLISRLHDSYRLITDVFLIAGVYDLRPLLQLSDNANLRMTSDEAWNLSPMNAVHLSTLCQIVNENEKSNGRRLFIVAAEHDSPSLLEQSQLFYQALKKQGLQNVESFKISGVDHFDAIERLTDPEFLLTKKVIDAMNK